MLDEYAHPCIGVPSASEMERGTATTAKPKCSNLINSAHGFNGGDGDFSDAALALAETLNFLRVRLYAPTAEGTSKGTPHRKQVPAQPPEPPVFLIAQPHPAGKAVGSATGGSGGNPRRMSWRNIQPWQTTRHQARHHAHNCS